MLKLMVKYFLIFFFIFFKITFVNAEIVKSISVTGNERITDNTIIIFSKINIALSKISLNKVINNFMILIF